MTVKAIVLDIDGTLLTDEKLISPGTKHSLIDAQKKGIKVILASGRPTTGMLNYVKELEMDTYEGLIVSYNGACVLDCRTQEVLFEQALPADSAVDILTHLKQFEVIPMINKGEYMFVNDVYNNLIQLPQGPFNIIEYESRGGKFKLCEIEDLAVFADFPLYKILVAGEADYLKQQHEAIMAPFENRVSGVFSAPFYFEFTDTGVDKAKALDRVLPQFGIGADEVISFGDGHNDVTLIEYAGIGVAMGNAVEELKQAANVVTKTNNEEGIAAALKTYVQ